MKESFSGLNQFLGRRIFCNNSGFMSNMGCIVYSNIAHRFSGKDYLDIRKEVMEKGYVNLGKGFSDEEIEKIVSFIDDKMEDNPVGEVREVEKQGELLRKTIYSHNYDITGELPFLSNFIDEAREDLQGYAGSYVKPVFMSVYRTYPIEEQNGATIHFNWHFDYFAPDMFSVFVPLRDTDETGAPLYLLDRESSKKLSRSKGFWRDSEVGEDFEPIEVEAEKGDLILTDITSLLHRGSKNRKGAVRDMIRYSFCPAFKPMEDWKNDPYFAADREEDMVGISRYLNY